ncbi:MAG: S9 family peptidase, partial [Paucibacter sp.]|nr:S9 family peptidase [Roseateles sp.]
HVAARFAMAMALAATVAPPAFAASSGYDVPPKAILDTMLAPGLPWPNLSPTHDKLLLVALQAYPSIARVATPYLLLAGVRLESGNHSRHDTPGGYGITQCAASYGLVKVADGHETPLAMPQGGCLSDAVWSADGRRFAFTNAVADAVELWVGDAETGKLKRMPGVRLNPMFDEALQWMADQKTLLVKTVPAHLGHAPVAEAAAQGPSIQETGGEKGQSSTYEARDTLNNKHDEALFDHYGSTQLAVVDVASGAVKPVGQPAIFDVVNAAPDGRHVLVSLIRRPYSYVTTYDRFPHDVEVWDIAKPSAVVVHKAASLPLADRVPIHGVPTGPRDFHWRQNEPATLVWAEALDGGDWLKEVPERDKVLMQRAPFTIPAIEVARTQQRFIGFAWGERRDMTLLGEYDENRHWRKTYIMDVDKPDAPKRLLWDLSSDEKYKAPGATVRRVLPNGAELVQQEGDAIYLAGNGASTDGDRPFLDRLDLKTLKAERLFRSDKSALERFLALDSADAHAFLTWRQTPNDPPNAFLRTLGKPAAAVQGEAAFDSAATAVTHVPDPTPLVRQIKKRLVKYKRADGLDLSFTLYTPPGYVEGTRVPTILYAYPLDYADSAAAGQVTGSQQTFTRLREYQLLLLAGYAIIDRASFPVVGDPKRAYDTYMDQLVADAKAAVDEAVRLGVADPQRIGVTGHSHGALMTANLVAHTDLFKAGVATSGSYNKTLTPFGFQNERRSVWEAPEVYTQVSPFFYADKLKTPLLIVHGADDANPGTTPLQGQKLFEAIRGNGGTTRLVMLPHEPHWYTALESNEQLLYEMVRWFDKYVKNAPPAEVAAAQ